MGQISFQLPNFLLLANTLNKKCRFWMTEYNQSWSENIWIIRNEVLINEIRQKEFQMGLQTFEYLLNLIRAGIEKILSNFSYQLTGVLLLRLSRDPKPAIF